MLLQLQIHPHTRKHPKYYVYTCVDVYMTFALHYLHENYIFFILLQPINELFNKWKIQNISDFPDERRNPRAKPSMFETLSQMKEILTIYKRIQQNKNIKYNMNTNKYQNGMYASLE